MTTIKEVKQLLEKLLKEQKPIKRMDWDKSYYETMMFFAKPPLDERSIIEFEKKYSVSLPEEYKQFLTQVTASIYGRYTDNLGALPERVYYDLSKEFPHTEKWNLEFEESGYEDYMEYADFVDSDEHMSGSFPIVGDGCGYETVLVVNGKSKGQIWCNYRNVDEGIFPLLNKDGSKMCFLDFVKATLESELEEKRWETYKE